MSVVKNTSPNSTRVLDGLVPYGFATDPNNRDAESDGVLDGHDSQLNTTPDISLNNPADSFAHHRTTSP